MIHILLPTTGRNYEEIGENLKLSWHGRRLICTAKPYPHSVPHVYFVKRFVNSFCSHRQPTAWLPRACFNSEVWSLQIYHSALEQIPFWLFKYPTLQTRMPWKKKGLPTTQWIQRRNINEEILLLNSKEEIKWRQKCKISGFWRVTKFPSSPPPPPPYCPTNQTTFSSDNEIIPQLTKWSSFPSMLPSLSKSLRHFDNNRK